MNGIQRTPFQLWVQQAINASYQVVHAPLTSAAAAQFNAAGAMHFFESTEGVDYGYYNMLWGWIDTEKDNYPCVPPDFSSKCLQWQHVEVLFPVVNKVRPACCGVWRLFSWMLAHARALSLSLAPLQLVPSIGNMLYVQAWNLRMGTSGLDPATLFYLASQRGMQADMIPVMVEQDSWMYNTTRYGKPARAPSMVCCAFVCHMWKAGGLFASINDQINCGEQTNLDDYHMNILQAHPTRPADCQAADPSNPLCQLAGDFTLVLNDYATTTPYAHMDEKCPSLAPSYYRPAGC